MIASAFFQTMCPPTGVWVRSRLGSPPQVPVAGLAAVKPLGDSSFAAWSYELGLHAEPVSAWSAQVVAVEVEHVSAEHHCFAWLRLSDWLWHVSILITGSRSGLLDLV